MIAIITNKYSAKMEIGSKQLGKKDLVMVNSKIHVVLLYPKQMAEYLLVIVGTIVFKYSAHMANSCSNLVQKDQKMDNSNFQVD